MRMSHALLALLCSVGGLAADQNATPAVPPANPVVVAIVPIRDDITVPMLHLVRRGIAQAHAAGAGILILDIHTNGGRVDVTERILAELGQFKGFTVAYVNSKAISAGALISIGTQRIYMAPDGRIGDAAPVMMSPGGASVENLPGTMEEKVNSYVRSLARTHAQRNGHNVDVVEAMINKGREVVIDGEVVSQKGELLTLTAREAERLVGAPLRPMLSAGTKDRMGDVLAALGVYDANKGRRHQEEAGGLLPVHVVRVQPTLPELLAFWFDTVGILLLIVGIVAVVLELKAPGFGLPGIIGILAFAAYFGGSYVAELSTAQWAIICFLLLIGGLAFVVIEMHWFPGTVVIGVVGALAVLSAIVLISMDMSQSGWRWPTPMELSRSMRSLAAGIGGSIAILLMLARLLPQTSFYKQLLPASASGMATVVATRSSHLQQVGWIGVSQSPLRPSGKAMFGETLLDVMTQGEMLGAGQRVRVVGHSGTVAVVAAESDVLPT